MKKTLISTGALLLAVMTFGVVAEEQSEEERTLQVEREIRHIASLADAHPLVGQPLPELAIRDFRGKKVRLDDSEHKNVIIAFVDSQELDCKDAAHKINATTVEARRSGFDLEIIFLDCPRGNAAQYFYDKGVVAKTYLDRGKRFFKALNEPDLPLYLVTDGAGKVVYASENLPPLR